MHKSHFKKKKLITGFVLQGHIYVCALCTCIKYINTCMYIFKKKCFVCILNIYIQYTCISKYIDLL